MFNCNSELIKFHTDEVKLSADQRKDMRSRRDANRNRLKDGLEKNTNPKAISMIPQGSYAMHTMVNDKNDDYDIDDGSAFLKDDLVGGNGAELTPLNVRKMIREAIDDGSFKAPPEVKLNCVRVHYAVGYHIDIPVYRQLEDGALQLASSSWKNSSPTEVTEWYNESVIEQSPDTTNGRQMRRITQFIKFWTKSRESWKEKMPTGFEISVLVSECYVADKAREDTSLLETIRSIRNRLALDLEIAHPVLDEMLTDAVDDANTRFFRDKLSDAIRNLEIQYESDCSRLDALKSWNKFFDHSYWKDLVDKEEAKKKETNALRNQIASRIRSSSGIALAPGLAEASALGEQLKTTRSFGGKISH